MTRRGCDGGAAARLRRPSARAPAAAACAGGAARRAPVQCDANARVASACSTVCAGNDHQCTGIGMGMGIVCAMSTRSYAARGGAPCTPITIPRSVAAAAASSRSSASALTQSMCPGLRASKSATSAALHPRTSTRLVRPTNPDKPPASSHIRRRRRALGVLSLCRTRSVGAVVWVKKKKKKRKLGAGEGGGVTRPGDAKDETVQETCGTPCVVLCYSRGHISPAACEPAEVSK